MRYSLVRKPTLPADLEGVGVEVPSWVPLRNSWFIGCWHPALPEVAFAQGPDFAGIWHHAVAAPSPTIRTSTGGGWMWRGAFAGIALSLLLPFPALAAEPCKVNVQTCAAAECSFLPGIGPSKGAAIEAAHPADEAALDAVPGIGEATLAKIKPYVVFTGPTTCTSKQGGKDGVK